MTVALDAGVTSRRAELMDGDFGLLARSAANAERTSPAALLTAIGDCVAAGLPAGGLVTGIGVAMKGLVDHVRGVMVDSGSLGMRDVPVKASLEERFGRPVVADNDVHAATIGEIHHGAGRRFRDFVYIIVGTGVLASGPITGSARCGALMITEMAKVQSWGDEMENYLHGRYPLIDETTPCSCSP